MAVYTQISKTNIAAALQLYSLGELDDVEPIAAGVTNSIYKLQCDDKPYILTIFESLTADEVAPYLAYTSHLSQQSIPVQAIQIQTNGQKIIELAGKPAVIASYLPGRHVEQVETEHAVQLGTMLAKLHVAGMDFKGTLPCQRNVAWHLETYHAVQPHLSGKQNQLLNTGLNLLAQQPLSQCPESIIHCDLFRDNVLFDAELSGLLDFYYATKAPMVLDIAICLNEWCTHSQGELDQALARSLLKAYHAERPLTPQELASLEAARILGACRFWLSRLYDYHNPNPSLAGSPKDPQYFERIMKPVTHKLEQ